MAGGQSSAVSLDGKVDDNSHSVQDQMSLAPESPTEPTGELDALAALVSQKIDLGDPQKRAELVARMKALEDATLAAAHEKAKRLGVPLEVELPGGGKVYLVGFEGDRPLYEAPDNANAAISTAANRVRSVAPYHVSGHSYFIGLWESGGVPRMTHQEFGGRVVVRDGATEQTNHATHVAGTLAGSGVNPGALGMAPAARIHAYSSTNSYSEMTAAGAAYPGESGKIQISNHSYGVRRGWYDDGVTWLGVFSDDGDPGNDVDYGFGRYDSAAATLDGLAYNLPYYLPFYSNGNMRNQGPPVAGATWYQGTGGTPRTYSPAQHPAGNGVYKNQYDTMDGAKTAKNIMSIGAVNDAVSAGQRHVPNGTLTSFSSSGPTDDGRIKPDVVANGAGLSSAGVGGDTQYYSASGTSMSTPNAAGSALLLVDYYGQRFPGQAMRASTLKALVIHTADDVGGSGPDYLYGWGLMNTESAARVIDKHAASTSSPFIAEDLLTTADGSHTHRFVWDGVEPIRVTLCWTDPPGTNAGTAPSSHDNRTPRLVNDLNLSLAGPGGSVHLPYVMPYVGNWSNAMLSAPATTGVNSVDNVEQVYVASPPHPGLYTITVNHAGSLTHGEQRYSLIITGGVVSDVLSVAPYESFETSGGVGGPFSPSSKTYTLGNGSGSPIDWTASVDRPWLVLNSTSGTLVAGGSFGVTVAPSAAANSLPSGIHEARVTFANASSGLSLFRTVRLQVTGHAELDIEQPVGNRLGNGQSAVFFGEARVDASSSARTFTLRNSGGATLSLSSLGIQGTHADDFQMGSPSATVLVPGQTITLPVSFAPRSVGARTAELRIGSNDPNDNPYVVSLQGVGLPSVNADLAALALSNGALSPAFSRETVNYAAGVSSAAQWITVTPTKAQVHASVQVRVNGGGYSSVASGSASTGFALNTGSNSIEVLVTAAAGNSKAYTIAVTRDKAAQSIAFPPITDKLAADTVTLSATGGSSGNPVTFTASGPATITNGNQLRFTGPGEVTVKANQAGNANYHSAPEVAHTFMVTAVPAEISLGNLSHVYDGLPKTATVTTVPAGLAVRVVGAGPWTDVGNYGIVASVTDPRYVGSTSGILGISKARQSIAFDHPGDQLVTTTLHLSATGGGSGRPVTFTVIGPATLTGGNQLSFTGPGQVTVRASQLGDANYHRASDVVHTVTVTAVPASITFTRLHQVADGTAREVHVTTDPPDFAVEIAYDGEADAPAMPGSYTVVASSADPRYAGTVSDTLLVDDPTRSVTVPGGALPDFSAFGELSVPTFRIGAYEVTGSQWAAVVAWAEAHAGYDFDGAGSAASGDRPVAEIAWSDAAKWCNARTEWENAISGRSLSPAYRVGGAVFRSGTPASPGDVACDFGAGGYRLPTAAEWEFAARGGAGGAPSLYPGGGDLEELGWHSGNSGGGAQPAGGKAPNSLGLHDLAGNVAEWTWDAPIDNPAARLLRGGSWQGAASDCELSALASADSALPSAGIGLRLVRSVSLALAEVLDHPGLSWESGGPEPWVAQTGTTHDGEDAAESSPLAQGETAWMETVVEGPGNLSFRWKTDGAEGADILSFAVGGAEAFVRSGIGGWEEQIVEIDEGSHLLRWTYARGSATGESRAWIDSVAYAEATVPSVTTAPASGIGGTSVTLGGEVVHDGGREITGRGVVYGPSPDPTLDSGTVLSVDTQGEGSFAVLATGLSGNTVLYARAYAINLLGTAYGESVVFTTASIADFADGPAAFDREILPGDQQRFQFSLAGPRFVSFSTVGGASLRAVLRNSQGEVIAGFDGDADFALVQLLHAGAYLLEVYRQPGEGERQDYRLTLDAGTVAATRPDVAVGSSPSKLMGRNVHLPARQLASLVSKKAKPVTAYAAVGNAGNLPDVLLARAGKGNGFFKVTYHAPTGNATASLLAGSYRTARVANGVGSVSIRIAVKPNKKKLTRSKGGRPSTLRKTLTLPVSASSTFQPSTGDAASVQVKTK